MSWLRRFFRVRDSAVLPPHSAQCRDVMRDQRPYYTQTRS